MPALDGTGAFFPLLVRSMAGKWRHDSPVACPGLCPAACSAPASRRRIRRVLYRKSPYPVANIREPEQHLPVNNVILMIGDGMGIHHLSAAWAANRGRLFIENCPVTGIAKPGAGTSWLRTRPAGEPPWRRGPRHFTKRVATCPEGNKLDSLIDKAKDMEESQRAWSSPAN